MLNITLNDKHEKKLWMTPLLTKSFTFADGSFSDTVSVTFADPS